MTKAEKLLEILEPGIKTMLDAMPDSIRELLIRINVTVDSVDVEPAGNKSIILAYVTKKVKMLGPKDLKALASHPDFKYISFTNCFIIAFNSDKSVLEPDVYEPNYSKSELKKYDVPSQ